MWNIPRQNPHLENICNQGVADLLGRMFRGLPSMAAIRFSSSTSRPDVRILPQLDRERVNYTLEEIGVRGRHSNTRPTVSMFVKDNFMYHWKDDVPVYFPQSVKRRQSDLHEIEPMELPYNVQEARNMNYPNWLIQSNFEPEHQYSQALNTARNDLPVTQHDFENDRADSDFEMEVFDEQELARASDYAPLNLGLVLEEFYAEITDWIVHPTDNQLNGHINSDPFINGGWVRWFVREPSTKILTTATHSRNSTDYIQHMSSFLFMHIRAQVINELKSLEDLEEMRTNPQQFLDRAYRNDALSPFRRLYIEQVTASKYMYHIDAETNEDGVVDEIYDAMLGLSLCIGFLQRTQNDSRVGRRIKRSKIFFFIVRCASFQGDDLERMGINGNLDVLSLSCSLVSPC